MAAAEQKNVHLRYHQDHMVKLGVAITAATLTILVAKFLHHPARARTLPVYGWLGLLALAGAEWLMFHGVEPVATYFTPIAWTAYILVADAAVFAVAGHSRLRDAPRQFGQVALLSVPLWLLFEAYNLRLTNWDYTGLPLHWLASRFGYAWSFATITPGIFVTADLVESFGWFARPSPPVRFSTAVQRAFVVFGAFLLVPINRRLRLPSLLADLEQGRRARLYALLASGWICGWLWEFWNYWASAKWHYTFPIYQRWRIFEMPAPGYFGFLPFALECYIMYIFAAWLLGWTPARIQLGRPNG